jgi:exonuclease SbcC
LSNFKVRRIYIQNFKHIDKLYIDFSKKDLIVLDGPNGFGKTTIFDAIELTLTGQISRVKNTADGRYGYNDILFSNKNNIDTLVKVEFVREDESFVVAKRINSQKRLTPSDRKPDNWGIFETYLLVDFDMPITKGKRINLEEINKKLGLKNLSRYFSLFYYVQQEENTYFLKQTAKDRMDEISQLFDTYKEEQELEKIKKIKAKLENEVKNIKGPKGRLEEKNILLNSLTLGIQGIEKEKLKEIEYFSLFPEDKEKKEWDKEDISIQKDARERYLEELREIYKFIRDFEDFCNMEFNNKIQKYVDNNVISNAIVAYKLIDKYEKFRDLKVKEKSLKRLESKISKENLKRHLSITPIIELQTLMDKEINIKDIETILEALKSYKLRMGEISELIQNMNATRETLMSHYNKIKTNEEDTECPLCGSRRDSYEDLIKAVENKGKKFLSMYDESTQKFEALYNELFIKQIDALLKWIKDYFANIENIVDENFFNQLSEAMKYQSDIVNFVDWCKVNNLDIDAFLNDNPNAVVDTDSIRINLIKYLLSEKVNIKDTYTDHNAKKRIFSRVFNSDNDKVKKVSLEKVLKKVQYIDYQYYHRSSQNIKLIIEEIKDLKKKSEKIDKSIAEVKKVIEIYEERILYHWKKIIREIEIPFYIYSGKIIQDYQRGCGIFIYESDSFGQKSIRFVSNNKSNHDAINYLSSGQLSGLVIAFTLALNKVYGQNSIDMLLIDDPVQTMDEINIASFVELLRNEFREKQIFLSTHEEEVSRYMRYKFAKYGLNTQRVNVKNELYPNPLND